MALLGPFLRAVSLLTRIKTAPRNGPEPAEKRSSGPKGPKGPFLEGRGPNRVGSARAPYYRGASYSSRSLSRSLPTICRTCMSPLWAERVARGLSSTLREAISSVLGYPELAGEEAVETTVVDAWGDG
jgi:hypothetical protein